MKGVPIITNFRSSQWILNFLKILNKLEPQYLLVLKFHFLNKNEHTCLKILWERFHILEWLYSYIYLNKSIFKWCDNNVLAYIAILVNNSSNLNEVIKVFYKKILHAQKAQKALSASKAPKALKGTKTLRKKHKMQINK